jgi:isopenicillin N synthase-like dioxygenase
LLTIRQFNVDPYIHTSEGLKVAKANQEGEASEFADFDNKYLEGEKCFGIKRHAVSSLPIIDVSPFVKVGTDSRRRSVARKIREACIDVGFFYLTGHGFTVNELNEAIAWGHRFYEMPLDAKMALHTLRPGQPGFMRIGGIDPGKNSNKAADLKERFIMSRELLPGETASDQNIAGRTRWPSEEKLPGFTSFMKAHLAKRVVLAQAVARAFALSLELSEDHFDPFFRHLGVVSIINYYPPLTPETLKQRRWSFSPHTDYGGYTAASGSAFRRSRGPSL